MECLRKSDKNEVGAMLLEITKIAEAIVDDTSCSCNMCKARRLYNETIASLTIAFGLSLCGNSTLLNTIYEMVHDYRVANPDACEETANG